MTPVLDLEAIMPLALEPIRPTGIVTEALRYAADKQTWGFSDTHPSGHDLAGTVKLTILLSRALTSSGFPSPLLLLSPSGCFSSCSVSAHLANGAQDAPHSVARLSGCLFALCS
jgi:hypothetical protein